MTLPTMASELDRDALLGWAREIDRGPWSSLAVGERIAFPNAEIGVALAAAAAVTERVRLVSTVLVVPLHDPVWLAKQIASLDTLAGGRLAIGVGVGGREEDYRALGVPFARRHQCMDEHVARMRAIWSGEAPAPGVSPVGPAPARVGGPPLWVAAAAERPLLRAAHWAQGVLGFEFGPDLDEVRRTRDRARRAFSAAGQRPPRLVTSFWYALGADAEARLDAYARRYLGVFGQPVARALAARCRAAGEARVRAGLIALTELGIDEVILVPTTADLDELARTRDLVAALPAA